MEQSIRQLAKDLALKLEALEEGLLSVDDVAPLVVDARELYERLIALRYAAIEREVKGDAFGEIDDTSAEDDVPFRITKVLPGQTSLIDAIEEIQRENGQSSEQELSDNDPNKASNTESEETPPAPPSPEVASEAIPQDEKTTVEKEAVVPTAAAPKAPESARPAIPKNQDKGEKTIADRLRRTPIEDLRKAIGINQRFQFLNELFSGDNERYVRTIDEVNSADSLASALTILGAVNARLAEPDEDDAVAQALVQLVERRFL